MEISFAAARIEGDREVMAAKLPREIVGPIIGPDSWNRATKTRFSVSAEDRVASIINRAAEELDLRFQRKFDHTWGTEATVFDAQDRLRFWSSESTIEELEAILDTDGRARWWFDPLRVTVADLESATRSGLFLGDMTKILIRTDEPERRGGNGVDYWLQVIQALTFLKDSAVQFAPYLSFGLNIQQTIQILTQRHKAYDKYGSDLRKYRRMLRSPKTARQVGDLLGFTANEAETILRTLGFFEDEDGRWRELRRPRNDELLEFIDCIDTICHRQLASTIRQRALLEIAKVPRGQRAARITDILDSLESPSGDPSGYYLARAGDTGLIEVILARDWQTVLGRIRPEESGAKFNLELKPGRVVISSQGKPLTFDSISAAAEYAFDIWRKS